MGITFFLLFVCIVYFSMMALVIAILMTQYSKTKCKGHSCLGTCPHTHH